MPLLTRSAAQVMDSALSNIGKLASAAQQNLAADSKAVCAFAVRLAVSCIRMRCAMLARCLLVCLPPSVLRLQRLAPMAHSPFRCLLPCVQLQADIDRLTGTQAKIDAFFEQKLAPLLQTHGDKLATLCSKHFSDALKVWAFVCPFIARCNEYCFVRFVQLLLDMRGAAGSQEAQKFTDAKAASEYECSACLVRALPVLTSRSRLFVLQLRSAGGPGRAESGAAVDGSRRPGRLQSVHRVRQGDAGLPSLPYVFLVASLRC